MNAILGLLFALGIFTSGVMTVGYVTVMEFLPVRQQSMTSACIWTFYGGIFTVMTMYFQLSVAKNWDWINLISFIQALLATLSSYILMPESPKYALGRQKYDLARQSMH